MLLLDPTSSIDASISSVPFPEACSPMGVDPPHRVRPGNTAFPAQVSVLGLTIQVRYNRKKQQCYFTPNLAAGNI